MHGEEALGEGVWRKRSGGKGQLISEVGIEWILCLALK